MGALSSLSITHSLSALRSICNDMERAFQRQLDDPGCALQNKHRSNLAAVKSGGEGLERNSAHSGLRICVYDERAAADFRVLNAEIVARSCLRCEGLANS